MRFITELGNADSWVAVREDSFRGKSDKEVQQELKQRLGSLHYWISDLDDTDAKSPAKLLARDAVGTSHFNPLYLGWCACAGLALALQGKSAEGELWENYVDNFLRGEKAEKAVKDFLTPELIKKTIFPGVEEFYRILPEECSCICVSRNIDAVIKRYGMNLRYQRRFAEANDKGRTVDRMAQINCSVNYGVCGDSEEDAEMLMVLESHQKTEAIDVPFSLYVAKSPHENNRDDRFLVNTSRDRTALVELLE